MPLRSLDLKPLAVVGPHGRAAASSLPHMTASGTNADVIQFLKHISKLAVASGSPLISYHARLSGTLLRLEENRLGLSALRTGFVGPGQLFMESNKSASKALQAQRD